LSSGPSSSSICFAALAFLLVDAAPLGAAALVVSIRPLAVWLEQRQEQQQQQHQQKTTRRLLPLAIGVLAVLWLVDSTTLLLVVLTLAFAMPVFLGLASALTLAFAGLRGLSCVCLFSLFLVIVFLIIIVVRFLKSQMLHLEISRESSTRDWVGSLGAVLAVEPIEC
jgi:hypothetical protein